MASHKRIYNFLVLCTSTSPVHGLESYCELLSTKVSLGRVSAQATPASLCASGAQLAGLASDTVLPQQLCLAKTALLQQQAHAM